MAASCGTSCLHLGTYRILTVKASAHKRSSKSKTGKTAPGKKIAKAKTAPRHPRVHPAPTIRESSGKGHPKSPARKKKAAAPSARRPVAKGKITVRAEARRPELKPGIPSPPQPPPRLLRQTKTTAAALALLGKGIEYIFKKDYRKARSELKTLLETYPGEMDILARARSYMQICNREEAAQKRPAVTADQLYTVGVLEHNKANYDKAVSYFLQSVEQHPDADYIYYSLAASLAMKGDLAESLKYLRKAVELKEDSRIYAKNDSDFTALQTQKEFLELVGLNPSTAGE